VTTDGRALLHQVKIPPLWEASGVELIAWWDRLDQLQVASWADEALDMIRDLFNQDLGPGMWRPAMPCPDVLSIAWKEDARAEGRPMAPLATLRGWAKARALDLSTENSTLNARLSSLPLAPHNRALLSLLDRAHPWPHFSLTTPMTAVERVISAWPEVQDEGAESLILEKDGDRSAFVPVIERWRSTLLALMFNDILRQMSPSAQVRAVEDMTQKLRWHIAPDEPSAASIQKRLYALGPISRDVEVRQLQQQILMWSEHWSGCRWSSVAAPMLAALRRPTYPALIMDGSRWSHRDADEPWLSRSLPEEARPSFEKWWLSRQVSGVTAAAEVPARRHRI
jgi:hypothetical protein